MSSFKPSWLSMSLQLQQKDDSCSNYLLFCKQMFVEVYYGYNDEYDDAYGRDNNSSSEK